MAEFNISKKYMKQEVNPLHYLIIVLIGGIFFLPFLGDVHLFDWDEINFAESAREMIVSGNYSKVQTTIVYMDASGVNENIWCQ